jgi:hypothetical protein
VVQTGPGQKQNLIFKITRAKRAEGVAQAIVHLPSKLKALNSVLRTTDRETERERERERYRSLQ